MGYTSYQNPFRGAALIYLSRQTSNFLNNPKQLEDVMTALDPNSTASQIKVATFKLIDAMISDSQTKIEANNFNLYKNYLDEIPLIELEKELEDDTAPLSRNYFNYDKFSGEEQTSAASASPPQVDISTPPLETPNINPNLMSRVTGPMNQGLTPTEQALLSPEEQAIRLRSRGLA